MRLSELKIVGRNLRAVAQALIFHRRPFLAQIVPMRKCNLSCGYCNEFDTSSSPVPTSQVKAWIDHLARLRTAHVTISGGEPMLHPELDEIISYIRKNNMIAGLITNGTRLDRERVNRFNQAGLEFLQISIDNVSGSEVSKKSLRLLDEKLLELHRYASFRVNVNSVVGVAGEHLSDVLQIAQRAVSLGFVSTIGVVHSDKVNVRKFTDEELRIFRELQSVSAGSLKRFLNPLGWKTFNKFQENLINGRANDWRCRAGARYLYITEDGIVHRCSQQQGVPGVPLSAYTIREFDLEYRAKKVCSSYCTIGCVQRVALLDNWRHPQVPS